MSNKKIIAVVGSAHLLSAELDIAKMKDKNPDIIIVSAEDFKQDQQSIFNKPESMEITCPEVPDIYFPPQTRAERRKKARKRK